MGVESISFPSTSHLPFIVCPQIQIWLITELISCFHSLLGQRKCVISGFASEWACERRLSLLTASVGGSRRRDTPLTNLSPRPSSIMWHAGWNQAARLPSAGIAALTWQSKRTSLRADVCRDGRVCLRIQAILLPDEGPQQGILSESYYYEEQSLHLNT